MKIKNIVIVSDYAYIEGGASKVAIQSALSFSENTDLNIYFFAGNGTLCEELANSKVKTICLNMPDLLGNKNRLDAVIKGIYNKKAGKELEKLILSLNIDETVVHIHTWTKVLSSSVFKVCEKLKVKTFITAHDYFLACPNGACYNFVKHQICELKPMSFKCLLCNCDSRSYPQKIWRYVRQIVQNRVIRHNKNLNYIFISSLQEEQLLRRLPEIRNKYMVKNPIDVEKHKRVKVENNKQYFFIGRISYEKGPQLFCEAVTKAGVEGVVIGDGNLRKELEKKYPNIKFYGWLDKKQINELLVNARALIFPSLWYEGSPLVVPEVQAYGIPCVASACNAAKDYVSVKVVGDTAKCNIDDIVSLIKKFENNEYIGKISKETYISAKDYIVSEINFAKRCILLYKS